MPERHQEAGAGSRARLGTEHQKVTAAEDEASSPTEKLMEEVLRRENLFRALKRVRSNKGAPGVDGMTVDELPEFLKEEWSRIREELLSRTYVPKPVRVVEIPKASGGVRMLGIPTVLDRLIQQAILQVLSPIFEPSFSDGSFGFRPGRSAHQAVARARKHVAEGHRFVVDIDLAKFFDRVNHDLLMSRVARKIEDKRLLHLLRRLLTAGLMSGGVVSPRTEGTPQGGPLSPLLSNILLDDLDKELERRGHCFVRYADDANIYVRSEKAGERVMASVTRFIEQKLKLQVNGDKSAVDRPWNRKFLGYTVGCGEEPRLRPAPSSVKRMRRRVREILRRGRGRNIHTVIEELNVYLRGWFGYYGMTEIKQTFIVLDKWLRHHIRKLMWIRWKQPKTRKKKLRSLGIREEEAKIATSMGRGKWFSSMTTTMNRALNKKLLAAWGLLSLEQMQRQYQTRQRRLQRAGST